MDKEKLKNPEYKRMYQVLRERLTKNIAGENPLVSKKDSITLKSKSSKTERAMFFVSRSLKT